MNKAFYSTAFFMAFACAMFLVLLHTSPAKAEQYLDKPTFIQNNFGATPPKANKYWLDSDDKKIAQHILGHPLRQLRVSYWEQNGKSAWVLDEIGKVKPITIGVVVENQKIASLSILEFRESRGWEVKYPFFTEQFIGAALADDYQLNNNIDGITGATLSVRAVKNVARLALHLSAKAAAKKPS